MTTQSKLDDIKRFTAMLDEQEVNTFGWRVLLANIARVCNELLNEA